MFNIIYFIIWICYFSSFKKTLDEINIRTAPLINNTKLITIKLFKVICLILPENLIKSVTYYTGNKLLIQRIDLGKNSIGKYTPEKKVIAT